MTDTEENVDASGKGDYVQTLKYYAIARHNGQQLRCVVNHVAYSEMDKAEKRKHHASMHQKALRCRLCPLVLSHSECLYQHVRYVHQTMPETS